MQYISEAWDKARTRRHDDPEGAITAARTLLESVCKHILDEGGVEYGSDVPESLKPSLIRGDQVDAMTQALLRWHNFRRRIVIQCSEPYRISQY